MERKDFFKKIQAGDIAPCYVLEGTEEYIKKKALEALRLRLLPPGLEEINETRLTDPDASTLIAAAETLPCMAERRLVIVRESALLAGKAKTYDEAASADTLCQYLEAPNMSSCIVFYVRGKADGRKKLTANLKKCGTVVSFEPPDEREMTQWIARQLKEQGKKIAAMTCQRLTFTAGKDLYQLEGEINKLAAYVGEREEILPEDIDAVCIRTTSYRVYDLTSALMRGDTKRAFELAEMLLRDGEEEMGLLALLQSECRRMLAVKVLRGTGMQSDAIAKTIGAHPYAVQQLVNQVPRYTQTQLRSMTDACMDTEYRVKSGELPLEGALEKAMLQLVRIRMEGRL